MKNKKLIPTIIYLIINLVGTAGSIPLTTFAAEEPVEEEVAIEETVDETISSIIDSTIADINDETHDNDEDHITYQDEFLTIYEPGYVPENAALYSDSVDADGASDISYPESEEEIYRRIMALQSKYPHGSEWGMDKKWYGKIICDGYECNSQAKACGAFALTMMDEVFGNAPKYSYSYDNFKRPTYNDLHVGDFVGGPSNIAGVTHAQLLTIKTPTKLTWVSGNVGGKVWWYNVNPIYEDTWGNPNYILNNCHEIITCQPGQSAITFDSRGGSACNPVATDIYGRATLPTPTREGYSFAGWYQTIEFADNPERYIEKRITDTGTFGSNTTLYAGWIKNTASPIEITLAPDDNTIQVGETVNINTALIPETWGGNITWEVWQSNSQITDYTIKNDNKTISIIATKPGYINVSATAGDKSATASILIEGTALDINKTIVSGETLDLYAILQNLCDTQPGVKRYFQFDEYRQSIKYPQTNPSCSTIDKKGILTAKTHGQTEIRPSVNNENLPTIFITVLPKPVFKTVTTLTYPGQTINFMDLITNWTDEEKQSYTFQNVASSKPSIVKAEKVENTLDILIPTDVGGEMIEKFVLTANSTGSATISATACTKFVNNATKTLTFKTKVNVKVPSFAKQSYSMQTGQTATIAMRNVTASSGATFSSDAPDRVQVTAQMKNGRPTGKVVVKALAADIDNTPVTLIATIDGHDYTCTLNIKQPTIAKTKLSIKKGKTSTVVLKNTKMKKSDIVWMSEDENIARVGANGKIYGVSGGTTTIYTETGGVRRECVVTVTGASINRQASIVTGDFGQQNAIIKKAA